MGLRGAGRDRRAGAEVAEVGRKETSNIERPTSNVEVEKAGMNRQDAKCAKFLKLGGNEPRRRGV